MSEVSDIEWVALTVTPKLQNESLHTSLILQVGIELIYLQH